MRELVAIGKHVFLDLTLLEIPNSVTGAVTAAGILGLALTVITSQTDGHLREIGVASMVEQQVLRLANLSARAGCHGVVASAHEARMLRSALPAAMLIVTPGIQLADGAKNDRARVAVPLEAIRSGATHVVIGRSITRPPDPSAPFADPCDQVASIEGTRLSIRSSGL